MLFPGEHQRMSPEWWVNRLDQEMHDRNRGARWSRLAREHRRGVRPGLNLLASYREGQPPLPQCAQAWGDEAYDFLRMARLATAEPIISSAAHRIVPAGWRTGVEVDSDGDLLAAEMAETRGLVEEFATCVDDMLTLGDAYAIVGGVPDGERFPVVTSESPHDVITAEDVATRQPLAGLKRKTDQWTGDDLAYLYLPGSIRRARLSKGRWAWDGEAEETPLKGRLAIFRVRNRDGIGDFERHLEVLDRINDDIFNRLTIVKHQAFRQRGIELPDKDEHGNAITYEADAFSASPGALWQLPIGAKVWESMQADLQPIRSIIKDDLEHLALVTATPLYYLSSDAANQSAEGVGANREAHVFRVEDRQRRMQRFQSQVLAAAFEVMGETDRAQAWKIRTIWKPTERYSLQEKGAAAVQFKAAGFPFDAIATDVAQYVPADLPRLNDERGKDLLFLAPGG